MNALPPAEPIVETIEDAPPKPLGPIVWGFFGIIFGAGVMMLANSFTSGAVPSDTAARLEKALAQYHSANTQQVPSIYRPDMGAPPVGIPKVKGDVAPPAATGPLVGPLSPFGADTMIQPPGLPGAIPTGPVLPLPLDSQKSGSPAATAKEETSDLAFVRLTSEDSAVSRQKLAQTVTKLKGFSQPFSDWFGKENLVEVPGVLAFIPPKNVAEFESELKRVGGRIEERWRSAAKERAAAIEELPRTLLARLLTERETLLKDFQEDAAPVKDVDEKVERVRNTFRSLRPKKDATGFVAYRITLDESR
ncbi:MAG: hypothetical protein ACOYON_13890 [Fimbriimonas sp.]